MNNASTGKPFNMFSRHNFGGGEAGELAACAALAAHEATLVPGVTVQSTRTESVKGTVRGPGHGMTLVVEDVDGLRWEIEPRDLELVAAS